MTGNTPQPNIVSVVDGGTSRTVDAIPNDCAREKGRMKGYTAPGPDMPDHERRWGDVNPPSHPCQAPNDGGEEVILLDSEIYAGNESNRLSNDLQSNLRRLAVA